MLLISFLVTRQARAETPQDLLPSRPVLHSLAAGECAPLGPSCRCFDHDALAVIAGEITASKECRYELGEYKAFAEVKKEKPWYEEMTFTTSTLVIGVGMAGVLGYFLGAKR
jgi:hypothetical protein